MPRCWTCGIAGAVILSAIGLALYEFAPRHTTGADPTPAARPGTGQPATPPESDPAALVERVQRWLDAKPSADDAPSTAKPSADEIRRACEHILELVGDPKSEPHRFAKRHLLRLRIDALDGATKLRQRSRLANDVQDFLAAASPTTDDADLALTLATALEDFGPEDLAEQTYVRFGKLLVGSTDPDVAKDGEFLLGSARRMKLVGQPIELSGTTTDGRPFDIASLRGKVVLVDFWATWCGICVADMPRLTRYLETYRDRGFEIVGVSCDDEREALDKFLKQRQLSWTTLHDADRGPDHPAAMRYGVAAFPTQFLVDPQGTVVSVNPTATELRRWLRKLLGPPTASAGDLDRGSKPYPVYRTDEVIERLTDVGLELFESDQAHTGEHLRGHLPQRRREIKLATPTAEPVADDELYRKVIDSVFIVGELYRPEDSEDWEIALATAFAVTADGVLCTSAHVFGDDLEFEAAVVMDARGRVFPVEELLATDEAADTCLFRIAAKGLSPLSLADDAVPGSRVRVVSHPGDIFFFFSAGHVGNYFRDDGGVTWLNITADFGEGSSGAPVLDDRGNVIGQVSRTSTLFSTDPGIAVRSRGTGGVSARASRSTAFRIGSKLPVSSANRSATRQSSRLRTSQYAHSELELQPISDPQMVFKMCVPIESLRRLTKP